MTTRQILLRLMVEVMLSDSPIRFSEAMEDAVDLFDEDVLEEELQEAARRGEFDPEQYGS